MLVLIVASVVLRQSWVPFSMRVKLGLGVLHLVVELLRL